MVAGTLKGFVSVLIQRDLGEPFQGWMKYRHSLSQGFKANPGLKLANTFGVKTLRPAATPYVRGLFIHSFSSC